MGNKAIKSKVHPECYFFGSDNASAKGARFKVSALRGMRVLVCKRVHCRNTGRMFILAWIIRKISLNEIDGWNKYVFLHSNIGAASCDTLRPIHRE